MEAQDAERRKIERNLHDGAQQQLIALTIQLSLLEESADDPGASGSWRPSSRTGCAPRSTTCGTWPAASTRRCWPTRAWPRPCRAQARKAPLPVQIEADGIGRYPQDTEATVYFCTLEALQNIAKYARRLPGHSPPGLPGRAASQFTVTDDGDRLRHRQGHRHGTGLQGMADRLAALGGTLRIHSQPGHGTTLTGRLPAPARVAASR